MGNAIKMGIGVKNNTKQPLKIRYTVAAEWYSQTIQPGQIIYRNVGAVWMTVECYHQEYPQNFVYQQKLKGCYGGGNGTWLTIEEYRNPVTGKEVRIAEQNFNSVFKKELLTPYSHEKYYGK